MSLRRASVRRLTERQGNLMTTQQSLDGIAISLDQANDRACSSEYYLLRYRWRVLMPRLRGPRILELGCAEGEMTKFLAKQFPEVVAVDGSALLLERARKDVHANNVVFQQALFEEFVPDGKFSSIVVACVLEHVQDPIAFLRRCKEWLAPKGRIYIMVPNAYALNRRVGKAMGMLKRLDELHERDLRLGHQRVYSRQTLAADIESAGLEAAHWDGILLKPLSDAQVQNWDPALLDAFFEVGKELPEWCTEIYVECQAPIVAKGR